ncbi:MAG: sigma-70 family RNA polymerase sigma factor [Vicinamibacterales bacterium]|jgi:RNA polymerase sigma-70 factor (ECF subfamily)|nr:sigma-70 family RNA polymerase sigma factor [Vicinamibacterales bacterium]
MRGGPDDAELARRAAEGDADAFGVLVDRHAGPARRVARAVLDDPHDADDAAQEGFLAAWQAIEKYDPRQPFAPWLLRIVINQARDLRRRRTVRTTTSIPLSVEASGPSPEAATDAALIGDRLRVALAGLPERQRMVVMLFDAEGWAHGEIGGLLGIPDGTVRSELHHARRALRQTLEGLWKERS